MLLRGLPTALCVTALMVLMSTEVAEAGEFKWLNLFNVLPRSLRWKFKIGFAAGYAYFTSQRGREVQDVVNRIFELIPEETKKVIRTKAGETYLPNKLGYVCWGTGTAEGVQTLERREMVVYEEDDVTTVELKVGLKNLVLKLNACGNKSGIFKKVSECMLTLANVVFKVSLKVKHVGSVRNMVVAVLKRQCVITIVDIEMVELTTFKLSLVTISKKTGKKIYSVRDSLAEIFGNLSNDAIMKLTNEIARVAMYREMKTFGAAVCKDPSLEEYVEKNHPNYLQFMQEKNLGKKLSEKYYRYCGKKANAFDKYEDNDADWPDAD